MTRPDTLHEMESLLASIREAIETETGALQSGAATHDHAPGAQPAPASSGMDWQETHGDDDILWADEHGMDAHAPAGQPLHDQGQEMTETPHHQPVTSDMHAQGGDWQRQRPPQGQAPAPAAARQTRMQAQGSPAAPAARRAPAAQPGDDGARRPVWGRPPKASPSAPAAGQRAPAAPTAASARRTARLRLVKTDAAGQQSSPAREQKPASSFLSPEVRKRVQAAMARQKRIEEAKRALGGEQALRQLVLDIVEPIIAEWLNEHLADIVERRVARELARLREDLD